MATIKGRDKVEQYARMLFDAGVSSGRAGADLVQWRHAAKFTPEVMEAIAALQQERHTGLVNDVQARLAELVDADDSTVLVTATTAVPMDNQLRQATIKKCEELFESEVYLVERVEPEIVGGIILEARGQRFDASVKTQLATVRRTLSNAFMGGEE
ncbi:MAG: F0F1 ATP synthase subunit delta [Atopobiaceae bacterium]|nr:F0F1 ATP synthase subunit delta [Atopobiaceae bacterium]MBR1830340.1 F0F1 ATP synthase subunit delta [Atopobiaceae bacterium]